MKQAICALIYINGKPLGVSRKNDPTKMGLPGGKVEEGETPKDTVFREILEETGYRVVRCELIFSRLDEYGYVTDTFLCEVEGEMNTTETGVVREVTWEELFNGPFGKYNRQLYDKVVYNLEVKNFVARYERQHECCPKCGSLDCNSTEVYYSPNFDDLENFKDMNECECSDCGDIHTVHDRVSIEEFKLIGNE